MLTFWCPRCGNEMKAREEYAGRTARCPKCSEPVVIPSAEDARPTASRLDRSTTPAGGRRWLVPAAVLALLALATAGLAWWFLAGPGATNRLGDVDLALVPANAEGFLCLRPNRLWQHQSIRKTLGEARLNPDAADPAQRLQDETGLLPEDIDRVSFVAMSSSPKVGWAVVRTMRPYDQQVLQSRLHDAHWESHAGQSYLTGETGEGRTVSVAFVGQRVLVLGDVPGVRFALGLLRKPVPEGPLASTLGLCDKDYGGVFGYAPRANAPEEAPLGFDVSMLGKAELVQATMQLDTECRVNARAELASEKDADDLRKKLNLWKQISAVGLMFRGGEQGQQLIALLNAIKLDVKGKEVVGTLEADPDVVAPLLLKALERR